MTMHLVVLRADCVRPAWVLASSQELAQEKAVRGEYTPGGPWEPVHPSEVRATQVHPVAAGEEDEQ